MNDACSSPDSDRTRNSIIQYLLAYVQLSLNRIDQSPNFLSLITVPESMASETSRLDPWAFGLACGLLWAGAVAVLGLTARIGWGKRWERLLADVYRGYNETVPIFSSKQHSSSRIERCCVSLGLTRPGYCSRFSSLSG